MTHKNHTARSPHRRALLAGCAVAALLLAFAPTAQAKQTRLPAGSFGAATSTPANPYPISNFITDAVDRSSGDVYVADGASKRVEKFDSAGHFLLMFGKEVNKTAVEESRPEAEQNLCPIPGHSGDVCQPGAQSSAPGGFSGQLRIAIDNSNGPSKGDVYVGDGAFEGDSLVSKFDSEGHLITSWGNNGPAEASNGQLNGANATDPVSGPFQALFGSSTLRGLAVDPSGNLWVNANLAMFEFRQDGSFLTDWHAELAFEGGIAVDSEDNLYVGSNVTKYSATGTEIGRVFAGGNEGSVRGLAVDPSTDELYVGVSSSSSQQTAVIYRYDSSCRPASGEKPVLCTPVETFGAGPGNPVGVAVNPTDHSLYVTEQQSSGGVPSQVYVFANQTVPDVTTAKATGFTASTATLNGTVNPSGLPVTECLFEWGEGTEPYEHQAPCESPDAAGIGSGSSPVAVHAQISGLQPGHTYHFRLVGANANDVNGLIDQPELGADLPFGPPAFESASVLQAGATTADLQAVVNPDGADTHALIEYVTQAQFEANGFSEPLSTPEQDLGGASSSQSPAFELLGLQPATAYRYRVLAENALGSVQSADQAFTTQAAAPFALPDDRGWELVSPSDKLGAKFETRAQASIDGNAIAYFANGPTERDAEGNDEIVPVLSGRGSQEWASHDLSTPHGPAVGLPSTETPFFSSDLSLTAVQPLGPLFPSLSSEASEQTAFLRTNFSAAQPTAFCTASCYRPLVTAAEGFANVPPETHFGQPCVFPNGYCGPHVRAANPDLSAIALESAVPLIEGAPANSLYAWSAGQLKLLSVLPGGTPASSAAKPVLGTNSATTGEYGNIRNAVSTDGSRFIWSEQAGGHHLYLWDAATETSIQLDAKQPGASGAGTVQPIFQTAAADGSRVFFTDIQHLTADSGGQGTAGSELERDLYEWRADGIAGCATAEGCLADLTPETSGESAAFLGALIGTSEDGSSVYFVANGLLSGAQQNPRGEAASPGHCATLGGGSPSGTCNLYLARAGQTIFIATLSGADSPDWSPVLEEMTARVSPDGRWLAFMSQRSLTGYDNRDLATGQPDQEVYLYHAQTEGEEAKLLCPSCDPTGSRPRGVEFTAFSQIVGRDLLRPGIRVAASVRGWTNGYPTGSYHQPRYLADGGRLFFNTVNALVPKDSNGTQDIYQYESPQGEGAPPGDACATSSPTYSPISGGCVDLVSSGTSKEESAFLDASESGRDVFFLTSAQLSRRDNDTAPDVYDARVAGGEPEPLEPPICEGDACQLPAVPPLDPTPGSLTFQGAGNLREAKPKKQHKRQRRKHPKQKSHKRANADRGGAR
jgi:hypothetical protein